MLPSDGNDNVIAAQSNDIVDLGDGQDTVSFNEDADGASIYGRGGNDSLYITVAFDSSTASGGEGNDSIWLSRGSAQVVYGDAGNDSLEIKMGLSGSSVYGGNATTATSADGNDSIVLSSSVSNSFVQGNGGNDTMYVGSSVFGGSSIYGGQGVDLISVVGTVTGSTVGVTSVPTHSNSKMSSRVQPSTAVAVSSTTPLLMVLTASALDPLSVLAR